MTMQTAVIYSPEYLKHNPGSDHPESARRLKAIIKELKKSHILETGNCSIVEPKRARLEEVELVHHREYVQLMKEICVHGGGLLDLSDTVASSESYRVALKAVGGAIKAVDLVMQRKLENAFVLCRPPGHHAGAYYACGFCIFNNVAAAAKHLLRKYDLKRVLILDVDAHHGNGTQDIFYSTRKILFISLHQDPREFPGVGFADEVGKEEGVGYNVNIPFPYRVGDKSYLTAVKEIVEPIVEQYKPEFVLISAGFDGYYLDPVARLSLTMKSYMETFQTALKLADRFAGGKVVAVLEGGYHLEFLGKTAVAAIAKMAGTELPLQKENPAVNPKSSASAGKILKEVTRIQSRYWKL